MQSIISYIAIKLYKSDYEVLRKGIALQYGLLSEIEYATYNTLTKLLISGEDHRFIHHIGFDIIAILRAIRQKILYNKIEGASTIEQQLVRVITNNFDKTFKRKLKEILLSTTLVKVVPRQVIPIIYLNVAYYGTDMHGLQQAMTKLGFSKNTDLPIEIAAELVSRIKYPESKNSNPRQLAKIQQRKQHLISLYHIHSRRKIFKVYGQHL